MNGFLRCCVATAFFAAGCTANAGRQPDVPAPETLMTQQELDSETRRVRAQALQAELTTLNGALATANANLIKLMRESGLSSEQMMAASRLAMP